MASGSQGQATTKVREAINVQKLAEWLIQEPSLLQTLVDNGVRNVCCPDKLQDSIQVRQFGFGQSNPTYKLTVNGIFPMVLRKKPRKVAHKTAHALDREVRILNKLTSHNQSSPHLQVPVPRVYGFCQDDHVLGTDFYLQQFVGGRIFTDPSLPGLDNKWEAYRNAVQVLANLHSIPVQSNRPPYVQRQLERLTAVSVQQGKVLGDESSLRIQELATELSRYIPSIPYTEQTTIHGDFKLDNLVFDYEIPAVKAVLDWELSTIGDPLCDLANLCMMYFVDSKGPSGMVGIKGRADVPTRERIVQEYCKHAKHMSFQTVWEWSGFYMAFLFFKNAVIVQGVAQRAKQGVASSLNASKVAKLLPIVLSTAMEILAYHKPPLTSKL